VWEVGSELPFLTPLPSPASGASTVSRVSRARNADLIVSLHTNALARSPDPACLSMGLPNIPWDPRRSTWIPKGVPRWPKGTQSRPKSVPMRVARDGQRESRRAQLYEQTPDQPPRRVLCYLMLIWSSLEAHLRLTWGSLEAHLRLTWGSLESHFVFGCLTEPARPRLTLLFFTKSPAPKKITKKVEQIQKCLHSALKLDTFPRYC